MPPSKGKKPSRPTTTPSPSPSSAHRSTRSPSNRASSAAAEYEEDERLLLRSLLSRAASIFPNHISESALIGRIVESETSERGSAKAWLSEAAMVSSSLLPGSLVTAMHVEMVRLLIRLLMDWLGILVWMLLPPVLEKLGVTLQLQWCFLLRGYLLSCNGWPYVGFAVETVCEDAALVCFILSSYSQVLKNGVRLSYCLSATMGFPANGRSIYISPFKSYLACTTEAEKQGDSKLWLFSCKDLYLRLIPINTESMVACGMETLGTSTEKSPLSLKDGSSASPRTPLCYKTKFSSSVSSPLPHSGMQSMPGITTDNDFSFLTSVIEDEKVKEILELFAHQRLCGRYLLVGNLVLLPICGKFCIFIVEGASSVDLTCQKKSGHASFGDEMLNLLGEKDVILLVHSKTGVIILDSTCSIEDTLVNRSPSMACLPGKDAEKSIVVKGPCLGGLTTEIAILKQIINFSLMKKGSPLRYKGVLLHGPPGTGKTSLASTCAHDAGANVFIINGPEIVSEYYGESEQTVLNVFDSARKATPAVVFIDELDALAPARKDGGEELSLRMLATLLTLMDGICETDGVLVIGATNRPDSIDPALRRPGRFDKEIEIGVPTPDQRLEILTAVLDEMHHSVNEKEIQFFAMATHGFVGADLAALCNEAGMIALRRWISLQGSMLCSLKHQNEDPYFTAELPANMSSSVVQKVDNLSAADQVDSISLSLMQLAVSNDCSRCQGESSCGDDDLLETTNQACYSKKEWLLRITAEDLENAKLKIRPSAMREVMLEFPKVSWEDVGGQAEVKKQLIEAVQWPQICPDAFERIGICPPRGLLMFGPPGCSKTLMARAVASEAKLNFLAVKGPELFSKWVGESEKAVKSLFAKARANSPSIVFFDEIDGLATTRGQDHDGTSVGDRVLSQLLVELDGLHQRSGVTVIAATNRPDKIDPALLRPGRFDRHLDVKPPNEPDREAIFRIHMRNMPCGSDVTAKDLACITRGYTGADINLICREAAIAALEENFEAKEILFKHFQEGIKRVQPSDVDFYLMISEKFKRYVDSGSAGDL